MSEENTYSAAGEVGNLRTRRSRLNRMKIALGKAPISAWFGMIVISIYAFVAIFAPIIAPYGEAEIFSKADLPWVMFDGDPKHFFGTDQIGRDTLSRLIYGARNTIGIALVTTCLSFLIGGSLGLIAAINRSWLDQLLSRGVDVLMSIPSLIFALMLLSIFGSSIPVIDHDYCGSRLNTCVSIDALCCCECGHNGLCRGCQITRRGTWLGNAQRDFTQYYAAVGSRIWITVFVCVSYNCIPVVLWA